MFKKLMQLFRGSELIGCANSIGAGVHGDGNVTKLADAVQATRHVVVKIGSDLNHVAVCTADTEIPLGVCDDEAAAIEDEVNVKLLGAATGTVLMCAGATVTAGDMVSATTDGKIQTLSGAGGNHYIIGRALTTGDAGELIEVAHCVPVLRAV